MAEEMNMGEVVMVVDDNKEIVYSISELLKYEGSRAIGLDCTTCNHYTTNDNRRSGNFFISEPPVIFTHVNFILFRRNLLYLTESLCHGRNANDHERNRRFRQKKAIIICNRIDRCQ